MKQLGIYLLSSIAIAACASNNNTPPAASSDSVAAATTHPRSGPDFTPAASDGLSTARADTRRANNATQPAPTLNATDTTQTGARASDTKSSSATNGSTANTNGTWGAGSTNNSGVDPSTGNAAAAPTDRSAQTDADNTRVNKRDKGGSTLTPMDQGSSESDRKITQQIRQEVMKDKSLSFTAKNVKIVTINGKVTLRGPVKSEAERTAVEAAARRVAGGGAQVDSQLELSK